MYDITRIWYLFLKINSFIIVGQYCRNYKISQNLTCAWIDSDFCLSVKMQMSNSSWSVFRERVVSWCQVFWLPWLRACLLGLVAAGHPKLAMTKPAKVSCHHIVSDRSSRRLNPEVTRGHCACMSPVRCWHVTEFAGVARQASLLGAAANQQLLRRRLQPAKSSDGCSGCACVTPPPPPFVKCPVRAKILFQPPRFTRRVSSHPLIFPFDKRPQIVIFF